INRGVAAAYNTGIAGARGRFLAFQEADDMSLPHRLERQLQVIQQYTSALVSSKVAWIDENRQIYRYWPTDIRGEIEFSPPGDELYFGMLIHQLRMSNATMMLDRQLISTHELIFDEKFKRSSQDWDLYLRLVQKYPSVRINETLVHVRRHVGHSSSTSNTARVFQDNRRLLLKHTKSSLTRPTASRLIKVLHAWSNEFLLEARYYRGLKGVGLGALALTCFPPNPKAWHSVGNAVRLVRSKRFLS
ncbi:partial UDP-Glc:alpha-D-GlcNAc-diphosphoundecaprenol beta-1,3-glucosyltransferase WfgD, partial [Anaerolineae bacterium]